MVELSVLVDGDRAGGVGDVGNWVADGPREAAGVFGSEPTSIVRDGVVGGRAGAVEVVVVVLETWAAAALVVVDDVG